MARLVYRKSGSPVAIGDRIRLGTGDCVEVDYFRPPHSPSSEGKVSVKATDGGWSAEYYVSVIGAEWIERTDR
jgi:hypothetical protein